MSEKLSCYEPLDCQSRDIRILELLPEPHPVDNRIQCRLAITSLESEPFYEALSYTWGEPDDFGFKVWLNGVLVPVRQNLLCAIRVLRAEDRRRLWIDALSIDQEDHREKGHQVQLMGAIYRQAARVLSWLGTPDKNELRNKELDVAKNDPESIPVPAFGLLLQAEEYARAFNVERMEKLDEESWNTLERLCDAAYWNRMWITQEVCLARALHVFYGREMLAWTIFEAFKKSSYLLKNLTHKDEKIRRAFNNIQASQAWNLAGTKGRSESGQHTLYQAVSLTMNCVCQNRRDKIYGILGLAYDVGQGDITVDYTMSLPDLYHMVRKFIETRTASREQLFYSILVLKMTLYNPD
jgi:hypothetical protein